MSFRDRPEYQQWREDVFRLFGERCIRCGHERNLHAHHVRPVNHYPELAFDPKNGVPLCGNCHNDVNSDELAYVNEFELRQQAALQGAGARESGPVRQPEDELREQAEQDPSDSHKVEQWFSAASNSQTVVDFYNMHRSRFRKTTRVYVSLAQHLVQLNRHVDALRAAEAAAELARQEPEADRWIEEIAFMKCDWLSALDRIPEALAYLYDLVALFQDHGNPRLLGKLHEWISIMHWRGRDSEANSQKSVEHAIEAARLCPRDVDVLSWAAFVTRASMDYTSSFKYANAILSVAVTRMEKIRGHLDLADVYRRSEVFDQALRELRQVLEMDEKNVEAMSSMAYCLYLDDRPKDALRMAKRCLLVRPDDAACLNLVETIQRQ
jgi:tetratricopeptide (TPR) repeat protein